LWDEGLYGTRHQEVWMDTGMVRKIDDLGRIVVPAEMRRLFNIREGDQLRISVHEEAIHLQKLEATCTFCGSTKSVMPYKGKGVCGPCAKSIAEQKAQPLR
jgi:transcriptional pleiotropic regulator of transition state genes